jgi:hypothetical protein
LIIRPGKPALIDGSFFFVVVKLLNRMRDNNKISRKPKKKKLKSIEGGDRVKELGSSIKTGKKMRCGNPSRQLEEFSFSKECVDQVGKQILFYFSNSNLNKDRFLRQKIQQSEDGCKTFFYILVCSFIL